jgi:hypothetical protein
VASKATPILFFCNKKDLPHAVDAAEISKILDLPRIADRPLTIMYDKFRYVGFAFVFDNVV